MGVNTMGYKMYVPTAEYPCQRARITSYLIQIKHALYVKVRCTL